MRVAIGSDHAGYFYKAILVTELQKRGYKVLDMGTNSPDNADDYPDRAEDVANAVIDKQADRGILICGSAVGVSIAANKFKGIRAGVCHDTYSAHQCVEHDNVNILCMGERVVGVELAKDIALAYLNATFSNGERHVRRLEKISAIEAKNMK
jgi:ribose 5-phosphate isomerase B